MDKNESDLPARVVNNWLESQDDVIASARFSEYFSKSTISWPKINGLGITLFRSNDTVSKTYIINQFFNKIVANPNRNNIGEYSTF